MNAITMLKQDHRKVRSLFHKFDTSSTNAVERRQKLAQQTFDELAVHTKIEQEIFYPAIQAADQAGDDLVREALEEHHLVERLMDDLKMTAAESDDYKAKFKVLTENVRHHIGEEEGEMFPYAQRELSRGQLSRLGGQMAERKRDLTGPGFVSQAYKHAKRIAVRAFNAFSDASRGSRGTTKAAKQTPGPRRKSGGSRHTESRPRTSVARRSKGQMAS